MLGSAWDAPSRSATSHSSGRVCFRGSGPSTGQNGDRKSTRLNSSHGYISYAVFCLKKKKNTISKTNLRTKQSHKENKCMSLRAGQLECLVYKRASTSQYAPQSAKDVSNAGPSLLSC